MRFMMNTILEKNTKLTFDVAIVVSRFNEEITERLTRGALTRLRELNFKDTQITVVHVPGVVEIPLVADHLAASKQFKAIVSLGAVVRGETDHYQYVCEQVSQGCQQVMLTHKIPVIFGVLTTEDEQQALARSGGDHGNKGADAIDAACEMVSVLDRLHNLRM